MLYPERTAYDVMRISALIVKDPTFVRVAAQILKSGRAYEQLVDKVGTNGACCCFIGNDCADQANVLCGLLEGVCDLSEVEAFVTDIDINAIEKLDDFRTKTREPLLNDMKGSVGFIVPDCTGISHDEMIALSTGNNPNTTDIREALEDLLFPVVFADAEFLVDSLTKGNSPYKVFPDASVVEMKAMEERKMEFFRTFGYGRRLA